MACAQRLNQPLTTAHSPPLTEELATQTAAYLTLLQKSNTRTNLTAIRRIRARKTYTPGFWPNPHRLFTP
jgi:16S rRNA G527 N7-methylase RsmG